MKWPAFTERTDGHGTYSTYGWEGELAQSIYSVDNTPELVGRG